MARPQKFRHSVEALNDPQIAEKLGRLVLDIETLRAKRKQIDDQIAAAYDTVDDGGFEKKFVRKVVALRAKEDGVRREEEANLEAYEFAVEKGVSLACARREPARQSYADQKGRGEAKLVETVAAGLQTETGRKALVAALDVMIEAEEAGEPVHEMHEFDPSTGEIIETQESEPGLGHAPDWSPLAARGADESAALNSDATAPEPEANGLSPRATNEPEAAAVERRISEGSPKGGVEDAGVTAGETATLSNSDATAPRPASEQPETVFLSTVSGAYSNPAHETSRAEPATGEVGAVTAAASPSSSEPFEPPAFLRGEKAGCLKLRDGHCKLTNQPTALCSECRQADLRARAAA